jgi:hypothetical protein
MTRGGGEDRGVGVVMRAEAGATMAAARASTSRHGTRRNVRRRIAVSARLAAGLVAAVLATVSAPASATQLGRLRLPRPFAASGIVTEVPTVNVPTVRAALAAGANAGDEMPAVVAEHSRAFEEFMAKFDKAASYCPDSAPPCEESTRRERVFLENLVAIEKHNAERAREGGMKLGVTRFADLTPDEFANHHGHAHAGADEGLTGVGERERVSAAGAAGHGLEAPREVHGASGGVSSSNAQRGTTLPVAKLGAGGGPTLAPRLGDPAPPGSSSDALSDARNAKASVSLDASASSNPHQEKRYDCEAIVSQAVRNAAKARFAAGKPHSPAFSEFVERFGKKTAYCGTDAFPCEESYRREIILLRNMRHIEQHNAARAEKGAGGMKKIVTRFADLTPDEFAANHATYAATVNVAPRKDDRESGDGGEGSGTADAPRRALEGKTEKSEASSAEKFFAATDAALGWSTGLASLGDEEPETDNEAKDEATLGAEAAELALLSEEEDLAAEAAAAFARDLSADEGASSSNVFEFDVSRPRASASLGGMTTVRPVDIDLPSDLDWRSRMDIGPLYSQGACSGCWAYSTVQVIADSKLISTGHRPSPSPYYLLSCDELDSGCNTGNMATAYAWIQTQPQGLLSVEEYPTTGGQCAAALGENEELTKKTPGVTIDGFCEIPPLRGAETVHAMLRALKQQPIAVGMNVKPLQLYGGGLVQMEDCPPASSDQIAAINHAAVVVGWGVDEESDKPYWLVKNSYGQDWGENGYARLEMSFDPATNYGVCGFFSEQNYPLTDGRDCARGSNKKWSEKRGEDVYLMPDNVVVLPNGGGILTPARIKVFGYDLTVILKLVSFACFAMCVFFLAVEVFYCFTGGAEGESAPATPASARVPGFGAPAPSPERARGYGYGAKN